VVQNKQKNPSNKPEDQSQNLPNKGGSGDEFPEDFKPGWAREDNPSPLLKALKVRMKERQEGRTKT